MIFLFFSAAIQFYIASTSLFPKITELRKVFSCYCKQIKLINRLQTVNLLSLHIFPLILRAFNVNPINESLISENDLLIFVHYYGSR